MSKEQVASRVGMITFFSGLKILAVSPINFTPATTRSSESDSLPNLAISSESETHPPTSSARD